MTHCGRLHVIKKLFRVSNLFSIILFKPVSPYPRIFLESYRNGTGYRVVRYTNMIHVQKHVRKHVRKYICISGMYGTKFNCLFGISVLSIDKRSEMFSQLLSVAPIVRSLLEIMLSITRDFYHLTCEIWPDMTSDGLRSTHSMIYDIYLPFKF